jgi:hypothetical protein
MEETTHIKNVGYAFLTDYLGEMISVTRGEETTSIARAEQTEHMRRVEETTHITRFRITPFTKRVTNITNITRIETTPYIRRVERLNYTKIVEEAKNSTTTEETMCIQPIEETKYATNVNKTTCITHIEETPYSTRERYAQSGLFLSQLMLKFVWVIVFNSNNIVHKILLVLSMLLHVILIISILCICLYNCFKNPITSLKVFVIMIIARFTLEAIHRILISINPVLTIKIATIRYLFETFMELIACLLILPPLCLYTCCKMKISGLKSKNLKLTFLNFAYFRSFLARIC